MGFYNFQDVQKIGQKIKNVKLNKDVSDRILMEYPDTIEILEKHSFKPNNLSKEELIEKI